MLNFQGSGFSVILPEGSADASSYTFVVSTEGDFSAYVTIKSERLQEPQDIDAYASKQQVKLKESVENLAVSQYASGKRKGMDVVLATVEWGPGEGRICQKIAYFLVRDEKGSKIYTLTGNDLASAIKKTGPVFEEIFKSFTPNTIQRIEPGLQAT